MQHADLWLKSVFTHIDIGKFLVWPAYQYSSIEKSVQYQLGPGSHPGFQKRRGEGVFINKSHDG